MLNCRKAESAAALVLLAAIECPERPWLYFGSLTTIAGESHTDSYYNDQFGWFRKNPEDFDTEDAF